MLSPQYEKSLLNQQEDKSITISNFDELQKKKLYNKPKFLILRHSEDLNKIVNQRRQLSLKSSNQQLQIQKDSQKKQQSFNQLKLSRQDIQVNIQEQDEEDSEDEDDKEDEDNCQDSDSEREQKRLNKKKKQGRIQESKNLNKSSKNKNSLNENANSLNIMPEIKQSMFDLEQIKKIKSQQQFMHFGPQEDKNGKIISYSIIGKPEWYIKIKNTKQQTSQIAKNNLQNVIRRASIANDINLFKKPPLPSSSPNLSQIPSNQNQNSINPNNNPKLDSSQKEIDINNTTTNKIQSPQNQNNQASEKSNSVILKRKQEGDDVYTILNKEQILIELEQQEKYILNNQIRSNPQNKSMSLYEQKKEEWNKVTSKLHKILSSSQNKYNIFNPTLIEKSQDAHRQRIEFQEILEQGKEINQIATASQLWELNLRNKTFMDQKSLSQIEMNKDDLEDQKPRFTSQTKGVRLIGLQRQKSVELIRRPFFIYNKVQYQPPSRDTNSIKNSLNSSQMNYNNESQWGNNINLNSNTQFGGTNSQFMSSTQGSFKSFMNSSNFLKTQLQNVVQKNKSLTKINSFLNADIEDFYIKGNSKLQLEKESVLNDGNKYYTQYCKYDLEKLEQKKDQTQQKQINFKILNKPLITTKNVFSIKQ